MSLLSRVSHAVFHALRPPLGLGRTRRSLAAYLAGKGGRRLGEDAAGSAEATAVGEGSNTIILRWASPRGEMFARAWRCDRRVRPSREHVVVSKLFDGCGLAVPEIVLVDDSLLTALRFRLEACVERGAPGAPLAEILARRGAFDPLAESFGRDLARLHSTVSPRWGKPWRPDNEMEDFRGYLLDRVAKLLRRIPPGLLRLDRNLAVRALTSLAREIEIFDLGRPALVHGDISPANVFIEDAADGAAVLTWIDFGAVHYGHRAVDLSVIEDMPMPPGVRDKIMAAYAGNGGFAPDPKASRIFSRLRNWEKIGSRIVKRRRHPERAAALEAEQRRIERRLARTLDTPRGD